VLRGRPCDTLMPSSCYSEFALFSLYCPLAYGVEVTGAAHLRRFISD
jgi:hypothetical protein